MSVEKKRADDDHNDGGQEHEDRYPVDTVHVFDPAVTRRVWIFLFKIEVFRYLIPDSHITIHLDAGVLPAYAKLSGNREIGKIAHELSVLVNLRLGIVSFRWILKRLTGYRFM
jgi:hypothetical protein